MSLDNINEDIINILNELIDEIDNDINICDDCSIIDSSVKRQNNIDRSIRELYLCDNCSLKRHEDAQKVLKDLETLAHEVEERLQSIENTERELDQWRDQQLQKNRDFWDGNLAFFILYRVLQKSGPKRKFNISTAFSSNELILFLMIEDTLKFFFIRKPLRDTSLNHHF